MKFNWREPNIIVHDLFFNAVDGIKFQMTFFDCG